MIYITSDITIDEAELQMDFIRASGPGGQNVNKVASAVHLRFNVLDSPNLPDEVKTRLLKSAGKNITEAGILIIKAKRFRSQEKNRKDAIERLAGRIRKAAIPPKKRRPTRPTTTSMEKMKEHKKHKSRIKRLRKPIPGNRES